MPLPEFDINAILANPEFNSAAVELAGEGATEAQMLSAKKFLISQMERRYKEASKARGGGGPTLARSTEEVVRGLPAGSTPGKPAGPSLGEVAALRQMHEGRLETPMAEHQSVNYNKLLAGLRNGMTDEAALAAATERRVLPREVVRMMGEGVPLQAAVSEHRFRNEKRVPGDLQTRIDTRMAAFEGSLPVEESQYAIKPELMELKQMWQEYQSAGEADVKQALFDNFRERFAQVYPNTPLNAENIQRMKEDLFAAQSSELPVRRGETATTLNTERNALMQRLRAQVTEEETALEGRLDQRAADERIVSDLRELESVNIKSLLEEAKAMAASAASGGSDDKITDEDVAALGGDDADAKTGVKDKLKKKLSKDDDLRIQWAAKKMGVLEQLKQVPDGVDPQDAVYEVMQARAVDANSEQKMADFMVARSTKNQRGPAGVLRILFHPASPAF